MKWRMVDVQILSFLAFTAIYFKDFPLLRCHLVIGILASLVRFVQVLMFVEENFAELAKLEKNLRGEILESKIFFEKFNFIKFS
jgi:hypothetical protein